MAQDTAGVGAGAAPGVAAGAEPGAGPAAAVRDRAITSGVRVLSVLWIGQAVSLIGSGLTGFALSVQVFEQTGSVTHMASVALFGSLPGVLLLPFLGALVDRWDRAFVLKATNVGAGLCILGIVIPLLFGDLQLWHIWIAMAVRGVFIAAQGPAYQATATLLVSRQQLPRANGATKFLVAAAQTTAPPLAALLLPVVHVTGILLTDVATYVFALATLALVRIPSPPKRTDPPASLFGDSTYGWRYIRARPELMALLGCGAVINIGITFGTVLLTPIVLGFASVKTLGTIASFGGAGMLVGSLVQSAWGGPTRASRGVVGMGVLIGLCVVCMGLRPSLPLIAAASFGLWFVTPFMGGYTNAIWQITTDPAVQGRVFATRLMLGRSAVPFAQSIAGPLTDRLFLPLLLPGGAFAGPLGPLFGVGPGRGAALLLTLTGFFVAIAHVAAYRYTRLRVLDDVADMAPERAPASAPASAAAAQRAAP